ncbi:uncharacterized protein LOC113323641 [Papaver somniferum]|uniref:uncharacterized protein LOC113323641 n=1 Tax=Papaver somniferum TaxID=3469 RepID=UPI000E6F77AF|nr:uncharacterized protein LOC113323641 [Papaver somniferum]
MFRYFLCKSGRNLKRATSIINGESSSSSSLAAKYFPFTFQNRNVFVISKSRVTSVSYSFSTTTSNGSINVTSAGSGSGSDSDSSFVVSYLIDSCGLSESEAITASKKLNFKTTSKPNSVVSLLKTYGFTESHISKLIPRYPSILSSNPHKTLKPKLDFFKSKGLYGFDLTNFISKEPLILARGFNNEIIPSFDILKSILHSDQNVIKMIKRNYRILSSNHVKRLMVNLELLRNQGVPEPHISIYLIRQPTAFSGDVAKFRKIVEKTKEMGFHPFNTMFLVAIQGLASMSEANWREKKDVYKRWGWSEDHIQTAFRKFPYCMTVSEKKIMAVMNFLVNEMGYNSLSISTTPVVFCYSLKDRIIPRCSVIRILVSKGLIQEKNCINSLSTMVDKSFLEKFVKKYEEEVPEIMKVFQCQLKYQDLLQR